MQRTNNRQSRAQSMIEVVAGSTIFIVILLSFTDLFVCVGRKLANDNMLWKAARVASSATSYTDAQARVKNLQAANPGFIEEVTAFQAPGAAAQAPPGTTPIPGTSPVVTPTGYVTVQSTITFSLPVPVLGQGNQPIKLQNATQMPLTAFAIAAVPAAAPQP